MVCASRTLTGWRTLPRRTPGPRFWGWKRSHGFDGGEKNPALPLTERETGRDGSKSTVSEIYCPTRSGGEFRRSVTP